MENIIKEGRTRREFLKGAGAVVAGGVVVGVVGSQLACEELPGVANWWTAGSAPAAMAPKAAAYLVYDQLKCDGCNTCVLACSAVHEGVQSLSLGRLQIAKNPHGQFPEDVKVQVCRELSVWRCLFGLTGDLFLYQANIDGIGYLFIHGKLCLSCLKNKGWKCLNKAYRCSG